MGKVRSKFKLNMSAYAKLKDSVQEAYASVIEALDAEFDAVIEDLDEFSDLGFIGQDIIDTERFKNSKQLEVKTTSEGLEAFWIWNPHDPETGFAYAKALYVGYTAFGKKYIPGRPWVDRAIERVDPITALDAEMKFRGVPAKIRKKVLKAL